MGFIIADWRSISTAKEKASRRPNVKDLISLCSWNENLAFLQHCQVVLRFRVIDFLCLIESRIMNLDDVTTPFGRRPAKLAQIQAHSKVRASREPNFKVNKWKVLRDICDARAQLKLRDRSLAVLKALVSFHPELELSVDQNLVVFPSNTELASRANGIAETTLRDNLALLVDAGLVQRRDSPNGKRYARKNSSGKIVVAFGLSLLPLVTRAEELALLAEEVRAERRRLCITRERITLLRRDIRKLIDASLADGVPGDWLPLQVRFTSLIRGGGRGAGVAELDALEAELSSLKQTVLNLLQLQWNFNIYGGNDTGFRPHIQKQITDSVFEVEAGKDEEQGDKNRVRSEERTLGATGVDLLKRGSQTPSDGSTGEGNLERDAAPAARPSGPGNARSLRYPGATTNGNPAGVTPYVSRPTEMLPLGMVLRACREISAYGRDGRINSWRDLIAAAVVVRSMLGISPSAYQAACDTMGVEAAAATVACILQRAEHINSPGGYLRHLTEKAENKDFSLVAMVTALAKTK